MGKKLISVVIPAYNEEACVEELASRLQALFAIEDAYDFEVYIIENGSEDRTWELLKQIATTDERFKVVRLSRNFRMDGGLTAGLHFVKGDACVLMTADLQDPPEMISAFLRKWEEGWENVYGIVEKREGISPIRALNSVLFYWIAGKLTDGRIPKNASDFRLVDKKVYKTIRDMDERNRFVRGLFAWSGFKSTGISFTRPPRFGGVSNAPTLKTLDLAFKGIFAHSYKPLRLITAIGILISSISFISIVPFAIFWFTKGVPFAGFGTIITFFLLLIGMLTFALGLMSEYIGLIYEEVKQRPNFIVSEMIGVTDT
jgi:glycosyltransferase involved in cell wall biosynthesis